MGRGDTQDAAALMFGRKAPNTRAFSRFEQLRNQCSDGHFEQALQWLVGRDPLSEEAIVITEKYIDWQVTQLYQQVQQHPARNSVPIAPQRLVYDQTAAKGQLAEAVAEQLCTDQVNDLEQQLLQVAYSCSDSELAQQRVFLLKDLFARATDNDKAYWSAFADPSTKQFFAPELQLLKSYAQKTLPTAQQGLGFYGLRSAIGTPIHTPLLIAHDHMFDLLGSVPPDRMSRNNAPLDRASTATALQLLEERADKDDSLQQQSQLVSQQLQGNKEAVSALSAAAYEIFSLEYKMISKYWAKRGVDIPINIRPVNLDEVAKKSAKIALSRSRPAKANAQMEEMLNAFDFASGQWR